MAKNLFEVVQALFIPCVLLGAVSACIVQYADEKLRRVFWKSLAVVAVIVLLVSFLREKRLIKYNQINNIYLLLASLVLGLGFAVLVWIQSFKKRHVEQGEASEIPRGQNSIAQNDKRGKSPSLTKKDSVFVSVTAGVGVLFLACLFLYAVPVIIVLPFHFVGMDDTYFSTQFLAKCTGFLLGWLVCVLSVLGVFKVLSRCPHKVVALSFSVLYLINGFISFVGIVGIINSYYRRKIKIPTGLRTKLPQMISAEYYIFFFALAVLIVLAVAFFVYYTRIHGEYTNPAEHRLLKAFSRNNRRWATFVCALAVFAWVDMTVIKKIANTLVELSPSEEFQLTGDEIFIPLEQISDGHLHRFTWTNAAGKGIRFIVVQKKGMNFGVGFDACDVCGNVGYYERKNEVICNRCDVVMNKSTIGLKGGCNPVPLASRIENGGLVVRTTDLDAEAGRF